MRRGLLTPRIGGQPWSAPVYDALTVPREPPRLFCASAGAGGVDGNRHEACCTCLTDQSTRYVVEVNRCDMIAKDGQYEPFLDEVQGDRNRPDGV